MCVSGTAWSQCWATVVKGFCNVSYVAGAAEARTKRTNHVNVMELHAIRHVSVTDS